MSLAALKKTYQDTILDGMARALWLDAFARWADENAACRWCERAIFHNDEGWFDEDGDSDCPESDEGHEPDDDDRRPEPGEDVDDVAPETPRAAEMAAHDLWKLIAKTEELTEKTAMADLFELAMNIHEGEFQFDESNVNGDSKIQRIERERKIEEAYDFGFLVAMECLGHGVAWADDHKTKSGGAEFAPKFPSFEVHYDGQELTWSGRERAGAAPSSRSGQQQAQFVADEMATQFRQLGKITVVNPADHAFYGHSYVFAFGVGTLAQPRILMAWGDNDGDALDECADWIADNAPGLMADDYVADQYDDYIADGRSEEAARDLAERDTFTAGNAGHHFMSDSVVTLATDPDRDQLFEIADVAQNPAPGDEWGDGGAESAEMVEIVKSAIEGTALEAYEPQVFSPLSPDGRHELAEAGKAGETIGHGRAVFVVIHPEIASKAFRSVYREPVTGDRLMSHVQASFQQVVNKLNRDWPVPGTMWTTLAWGWGYIALTDSDGVTPMHSATFLIGHAYSGTTRENPTGLTAKGKQIYRKIRDGYTEVGKQRAKDIAERTVMARAKTTKGIVKKIRKSTKRGRRAGGARR